MGDNEKNNGFKMQFIDKLIVSMIGVFNIIVIVLTIIIVNNNYKKIYEEKLKQLDEIPYNETYKYILKNNEINFYKETRVIDTYKCTKDCQITEFSSNQFILDNDNLVPIVDDGKVIIYSIKGKVKNITLDDVPQTSINNKYGIIRINKKAGVINKHGDIILDCNYSDIDINTSHIVTINSNTLYVFNNDAKTIATRPITVSGDISISEKNNVLYINVFGDKTTTFTFDTKANKFTN